MKSRLEEIHDQVRVDLKLSGETMKARYDAKAHTRENKVGDKVWLYNPQRKKDKYPKLMSDWEGVYTVSEVLSDVTLRIQGGPRAKPKVVHANRLWHYHGP